MGNQAVDTEMSIFSPSGIVVALAGRRIDSETSVPPRFPFKNVLRVYADIYLRLREIRASAVVCSAACGADLLALDAAQQLAMRFRVIIPYSVDQFRQTSVVDRPHPALWEPIYDRAIAAAHLLGDLVELGADVHDKLAYSKANFAIIHQAQSLAKAYVDTNIAPPIALVVWDGVSSGPGDETKEFNELAQDAGFKIDEIITI
jgi:hypothetical protein